LLARILVSSHMGKYKLTVLSGAGVSAQSGLKTFRDHGGLWEGHNVQDVATPEAWRRDPQMVLRFYNERIRKLLEATPNEAHTLIAELEQQFDVQVITQNVDDLHERGGSSKVLHLHGQLRFARSSISDWRTPVQDKIEWGAKCPEGSQLRPDVVWFGEPVPNMEIAGELVNNSDILLIIGTSLQVYPAAGLAAYSNCDDIYLIDPGDRHLAMNRLTKHYQMDAISGMKAFAKDIKQKWAP
jgi:NAD-dependent deacetylase